MVLVAGAAWHEERRWRLGGVLPTGTCLACCMHMGSTWHKANQCEAVEQELLWMKINGRSTPPRAPTPTLDWRPSPRLASHLS